MLKMVFKTQPILYLTETRHKWVNGVWVMVVDEGYRPGINVVYNPWLEPSASQESISGINSLFLGPTSPEKPLPDIYVCGTLAKYKSPSYAYGTWRWNPDGSRWQGHGRVSLTISFWGVRKSRLGTYWETPYFRDRLVQTNIHSLLLMAEEDLILDPPFLENPPTVSTGYEVMASHFEGFGTGLNSLVGHFLVDEVTDRFIYADGGPKLSIYSWSSGKYLDTMYMPSGITDICLEDSKHVYVLLNDRTLLLIDYERFETLGAVKMPSKTNARHWSDIGFYAVRMAWDTIRRQMFVVELTPDESFICTVDVTAYQLVPVPVRLSTPIALKVPHQYSKIPVMSQVLGDLNEGVGGTVVTSAVEGSASMVDVPVTNAQGVALTTVVIEGHKDFTGDPGDLNVGNPDATPPNAGTFTVRSTARIPGPTIQKRTNKSYVRPYNNWYGPGAKYYVSIFGNDENNGLNPYPPRPHMNQAHGPWRTLSTAISRLKPGETLFVVAAPNNTWTDPSDVIDSTQFFIPSGTDLTTGAIRVFCDGAIMANPIRLHGVSNFFLMNQDVDGSAMPQGVPAITVSGGSHHVIFHAPEIRNTRGVGVHFDATVENVELWRAHFTGNLDDGLVIEGAHCWVEDTWFRYSGGHAIRMEGIDNTVHKCVMLDNVGAESYGLKMGGVGNKAYNNVIFDNATPRSPFDPFRAPGSGGGVWVSAGATDAQLYHNTIVYNNEGVRLEGYTSVVVQNNIITFNGGEDGHAEGRNLRDLGGGTQVIDHNLIGVDPLFFEAPGGIFSERLFPGKFRNWGIPAGSPAVNRGYAIPWIKGDFDRVRRPKLGLYDIGAVEYTPRDEQDPVWSDPWGSSHP